MVYFYATPRSGDVDEFISVDTSKLGSNIGCIVFVVNRSVPDSLTAARADRCLEAHVDSVRARSYNGHDFSKIETGELRVEVSGQVVACFLCQQHCTDADEICQDIACMGACGSLITPCVAWTPGGHVIVARPPRTHQRFRSVQVGRAFVTTEDHPCAGHHRGIGMAIIPKPVPVHISIIARVSLLPPHRIVARGEDLRLDPLEVATYGRLVACTLAD